VNRIFKSRAVFIPFLTLLLFLSYYSLCFSQSNPSSPSLKKYMIQFQSLLANLQMLKGGETPTDWNSVDTRLRELRQNINAMQKSDSEGNYSQYLSTLSIQVGGLEGLARKKDPVLFSKIDIITKSCFQCHTTHRVLGIADTKH
jgi:cytochrome c556